MNKYIKIWTVFFLLPFTMTAQDNVDTVLSRIEMNNTRLSALRKGLDAEKLSNTTGIYLQNPEVGFNYLWSDPKTVGNRTDISIRQGFDFPSAYGYRKRISESRNVQAELEYKKQRKSILTEARLICAELVFTNALLAENKLRLIQAKEVADAYQVMFNKGEAGILEHNKAQLNLLNFQQEVELLNAAHATFLRQLSAMNGGQALTVNTTTFPVRPLPADFDQWFCQAEQQNPELQWMKQEVLLTQQQAQLNRALSLPKASTGYMSENRTGEHFQGITVGISIPLWENKNTVKYANAKTLAWQDVVADNKLQYYNQLKIHFEKAVSLQKTVNEYRQALKLYQNADLLKKAFVKGEISLLNYLMELSLSYSTVDKFMKAENEFNKAVILLQQYQD